MTATAATDLVVIAFEALSTTEQDEAFARIHEARLQRIAGTDAETARFIRALRTVAEREGVGAEQLSVDAYRRWLPTLRAEGEDMPSLNAVIGHFGKWRRAKEALTLSAEETPLKIDARFRARRVGKVHAYREDTLRQALDDCIAYLGHLPLVVEFETWRQRELELAKAQHREISIPSSSPYRNRWGSWENALVHFGYSEEEIRARHEQIRVDAIANIKPYTFRRYEGDA